MLVIENAVFSYGGNRVIDGVSLDVANGKFVAILGPNGAGKSTLLRLSSGFLAPESGRVLMDGVEVNKMSAPECAAKRAFLEQETSVEFPLSAMDVVDMGGFVFPDRPNRLAFAKECLSKVGMSGRENTLYQNLSGGEKRRVNLARALCQIGENPAGKLLLLDEPAANLDPTHAHAALSAAEDVANKGGSVVVVAHDPNLVSQYADTIVLMSRGHITAAGTPEEIMNAPILAKVYSTPCLPLSLPHSKTAVYFPRP